MFIFFSPFSVNSFVTMINCYYMYRCCNKNNSTLVLNDMLRGYKNELCWDILSTFSPGSSQGNNKGVANGPGLTLQLLVKLIVNGLPLQCFDCINNQLAAISVQPLSHLLLASVQDSSNVWNGRLMHASRVKYCLPWTNQICVKLSPLLVIWRMMSNYLFSYVY